jgi:hypothetical protein
MRKIAKLVLAGVILLQVLCAAGNKNFTAGLFYGLGGQVNSRLSVNDFVGISGYKVEVTEGDFDFDAAIGIWGELLIPQNILPEQFDVLVGVSMIKKDVTKIRLKEKESYQGQSATGVEEWTDPDANIAINSIYLKPKYLFLVMPNSSVKPYISGKLSYNFITLGGDDFENGVAAENCFGFGASIGAHINDDWDIALAFDRLVFATEMDFYVIGTTLGDTLKGDSELVDITLSAGYRF